MNHRATRLRTQLQPGKQKSVCQIRQINKQVTRHFRALFPTFALTQATKVAVDRRYNSQLLFTLNCSDDPLRPRALGTLSTVHTGDKAHPASSFFSTPVSRQCVRVYDLDGSASDG